MPIRVHMVHQTRDRVRLRIPEKRKDLRYFLGLYEDLREIPGVSDVVINPTTGSVLLHFAADSEGLVFYYLKRMGLLDLDGDNRASPGVLCRIERFFEQHQGGAAGLRTVLFGILIALAVHQIRSGRLLLPAISVVWYAYNLVTSNRR